MVQNNFKLYCDSLEIDGAPTKPDSDISGIGVIVAFVLSAYITLAAVLGLYFSGLTEPSLLNGVDTSVMHVRTSSYKSARIAKCARAVILQLGDQQIVTGIAIMAAGFQGLRNGSISIYHYQIVLYLAWMSSSVHLSALTILGPLLTQNPGLLTWRLTGMCVLFVMLLIGLVPTISNDWGISNWIGTTDENSGWGIPAKCIWIRGVRDGVNPDSVIGYAILIVSYVWKVGQLFEYARKKYNRLVIFQVEKILFSLWKGPATRYCKHKNWVWLWMFRLILSSTLWILVIMESLASFAASIWMSVLGIAFGTLQVFVPRSINLAWTATTENSWGFGQLVPLILLIQPLGSVSEHIWPERSSLSRSKSRRESETDKETTRAHATAVDDRLESMAISVPPQSLIQHLTTSLESQSGLDRHSHAADLEIFYKSKVFHALVWLLQLAVAGTAGSAFHYDYLTIGNTRSDNWQEVVFAAISYIAVAICFTFLLLPFSKLGT